MMHITMPESGVFQAGKPRLIYTVLFSGVKLTAHEGVHIRDGFLFPKKLHKQSSTELRSTLTSSMTSQWDH